MSTGLALKERIELLAAGSFDDDTVVWGSESLPGDFFGSEMQAESLAPEDSHFALDTGEVAPPLTRARLSQLLELYEALSPSVADGPKPLATDVDDLYPV